MFLVDVPEASQQGCLTLSLVQNDPVLEIANTPCLLIVMSEPYVPAHLRFAAAAPAAEEEEEESPPWDGFSSSSSEEEVAVRAGGPGLDGGLPCQRCTFRLVQHPDHQCVLPIDRTKCLYCAGGRHGCKPVSPISISRRSHACKY